MPLDELAVKLNKPITHKRPRWEIGNAPNPLGGTPSVVYLGSWVYCTEDGEDIGEPMRDSELDRVVKFDPANPAHLSGFAALDAIVKGAYRQDIKE